MQDYQLYPDYNALNPVHFTVPTGRNLIQNIQQPPLRASEVALVLPFLKMGSRRMQRVLLEETVAYVRNIRDHSSDNTHNRSSNRLLQHFNFCATCVYLPISALA